MLKKLSLFILILTIFASCGEKTEDINNLKAIGGARYGGEFRFMSSEKISALFPPSTEDVYTQRIINQIFENLLKIDHTGTKIIPSLAESFTVNNESTLFTFKLRSDVYFHDNECFEGGKGRLMTAEDVKFSLEFACSSLPENKVSLLLVNRVKGAKEFFGKTKKSLAGETVSGIKIIDEKTITIELLEPFVGFDKIISHAGLGIFPKEAYEKYKSKILKNPVGTGPFKMENWTEDKLILSRNNKYWLSDEFGNKLPFLEKVVMTYSSDKKSELIAFRKEEIDLVLEIPVEEIENILGSLEEAQAGKTVKHKVDAVSSMSLTYFGFAHQSELFSDIRVRKAFNLALNKNEIIDKWLLGEGYALENGFVPSMEGYPSQKVRGFKFDIKQAQTLLGQAGFPNGKNFPIIDLYVNAKDDSKIHRLAMGVQEQLKANLNINIVIKLCSINDREEAVKNGTAIFWRSGWIADYPDPENFLSLFYGGNVGSNAGNMNPFNYFSKEFDSYYEQALKEKNNTKRNELLVKCDQLIIDDAAVMPLMNDDFTTMINSKIKNFETNSMEILDFTKLYIKDSKK
jgi:oligopeptide transport system substrate-binding protein